MAVWDVQTCGEYVTACCYVKDYGRLRPFARRTGTRVRAVKKRGCCFVVRPLWQRPGLWVGAAAVAAMYMVLGGSVWVVDVRVDDAALRRDITAALASQGVTYGASVRDIDTAAVGLHTVAQMEELHALSLYFQGCVARVDVRLREDGLTPPDKTPSNIVAAHDGYIEEMRVTSGQAVVRKGDAVVKGDLLVCGAVETKAAMLWRRSAATVMAETTRVYEERLPRTLPYTRVGRVVEQPTVYLLTARVPLYSQFPLQGDWREREVSKALTLFDVPLPVGVDSRVYEERVCEEVTYSDRAVEWAATERLKARVAADLQQATIRDIRATATWEGDTYCLRWEVTALEDIAQTVPILFE